jgi:hypothetical protein
VDAGVLREGAAKIDRAAGTLSGVMGTNPGTTTADQGVSGVAASQ